MFHVKHHNWMIIMLHVGRRIMAVRYIKGSAGHGTRIVRPENVRHET